MNDRIPQTANKTDTRQAADPASPPLFAILYQQMLNGLGLSTATFQMFPKPSPWDWPTETDVGYITAEQYDFCSAIPQFSASGAYVSSGDKFDDQYGNFLSCLVATATTAPEREAIEEAQNAVADATATLEDETRKAKAAYLADPTVVNNSPTYTVWLAGNAAYANTIQTATAALVAANKEYQSALTQGSNPALAKALKAYNDPGNYTQLDSTESPTAKSVPIWTVAETSAKWIDSATAATTISFTSQSQAYAFSDQWAQGSADVDEGFFSFEVDGKWENMSEFNSDSQLSVTINAAAMNVVQITPGDWYSGVKMFANGPYRDNFSEFKDPTKTTTWMFGDGGVLPILTTGMLVVLNPTIEVTVSLDTYNETESKWSVAGGIQIGPFTIGGSGGSTNINWTKTDTTATMTVADTSGIPQIFGVTVAVLP